MFSWLRRRRKPAELIPYVPSPRLCGPMCPACADEASEPIEPERELRIVGGVPRPRDSRGRFLKAEGHAGAESSVVAELADELRPVWPSEPQSRVEGPAPTRGDGA